jgi:hypothetical protein
MSNVGKWDGWYRGMVREQPEAYGDIETYKLGAKFLERCMSIEDWGCGKGFMRTLCNPNAYIGIDGSHTPHADVIDDLVTRISSPHGIFIRHVLEHNYDWGAILDNAIASARQKLCIVLFTPLVEHTHEIAWNDIGVPDIAFRLEDITDPMLEKFHVKSTNLATATQYGEETIIYGERL